MLKKDLAAALDISLTMLRRLEARGMPVDSIEAAKRWRARNLETTRTKAYRFGGNTGVAVNRQQRRQAARRGERQDTASDAEILSGLAVMGEDEALSVVAALGAHAAILLPLGRFDEVEAPLRSALRAVPMSRRAEIAIDASGNARFSGLGDVEPGAHTIPVSVWERLLQPLIDLCTVPPGSPPEAQSPEGDAQLASDMYGFAAGEWKLGPADAAQAVNLRATSA